MLGYVGVIKGDTRSSDFSSYVNPSIEFSGIYTPARRQAVLSVKSVQCPMVTDGGLCSPY